MHVQAYLNFDGRCEEAIEFYRKALGAEVLTLVRFKDNPDTSDPEGVSPGMGNKVLHASLRIGESVLMASDCACEGVPNFEGISLSLAVDTDAEAKKYFDELGTNGDVEQPLMETFFSSSFGMVTDRFGVSWMVITKTEH